MFPFKEAIQILITESSSPYFAALSPSCSSLAVTQALQTLMKCRIFVFNVGQSWSFLIQASVVWPPPKRDGEEWKLRYALLCMRLDISRYARVCGLIRRPFPIFVFYFPCLATLAGNSSRLSDSISYPRCRPAFVDYSDRTTAGQPKVGYRPTKNIDSRQQPEIISNPIDPLSFRILVDEVVFLPYLGIYFLPGLFSLCSLVCIIQGWLSNM